MTALGGQNPIEPGAQGKAIVFGPNMQNFADITRTFLKRKAAVQTNSPEELERVLGELLENPAKCSALGQAALEVVAENLGAVQRTVSLILPELQRRGIYVKPQK